MKTPRFGANPDHCRAGNFEAGCQRWNIPTYCVQYCTNCWKLLVKELKHQIWFSLQTECCKIWWKNWNTRHNFPFRQNAAKFGERIETPDTIFPSDRMQPNLVKELKHQIQFPFKQNAAQANSHPACWSCGLLQANLERSRLLNATQYWTLLCHHCNHSAVRQAVVCGALQSS